jgi:hypothetical protein
MAGTQGHFAAPPLLALLAVVLLPSPTPRAAEDENEQLKEIRLACASVRAALQSAGYSVQVNGPDRLQLFSPLGPECRVEAWRTVGSAAVSIAESASALVRGGKNGPEVLELVVQATLSGSEVGAPFPLEGAYVHRRAARVRLTLENAIARDRQARRAGASGTR